MILRNIAAAENDFFSRTWEEFKLEFGTIDSLYWIGLDNLHELSQLGCALRFELQYEDGNCHYAQYSTFSVGDSADNYRLNFDGYSGDLPDSTFQFQNNAEFSTYDNGPCAYCADYFRGAWWYDMWVCCEACLTSHKGFYVIHPISLDWFLGYSKTVEVIALC